MDRRQILLINFLGVRAAFTSGSCGDRPTAQRGTSELMLVQIIQLYFPPTISKQKACTLTPFEFPYETETSIPGG